MKIIQAIINWIWALLDNKKYKIGAEVFREERGWKLTGLDKLEGRLYVGTCKTNREPQASRIYLAGRRIYEGGDETITQPVMYENSSWWVVGECGHVINFDEVGTARHYKGVKWATHVGTWKGRPVVFDYDGDAIRMFHAHTGDFMGLLPGKGVITASEEYDGGVVAAVCDSNGGFASTDNKFIQAQDTLCLCTYTVQLYGSRGNQVVRVEWDRQRLMIVDALPCAKVVDMAVFWGRLWVATANPDSIYCYKKDMSLHKVGEFENPKPIGGSVFHARVRGGYYGRCEDNKTAVVYKIKE